MAAFERAWEQIKQHSKYNSAVTCPDLKAVNDKMPTTNYAIEANAKENNHD